MYGHSAGGGAVTEVLHENPLVRAGINLEGYLGYPPSVPGGAAEPFPVAAAGVDPTGNYGDGELRGTTGNYGRDRFSPTSGCTAQVRFR